MKLDARKGVSDNSPELEALKVEISKLRTCQTDLEFSNAAKEIEILGLKESIHRVEILHQTMRKKLNENLVAVNQLTSTLGNLHKGIQLIIESVICKKGISLSSFDEIVERVRKPEIFDLLPDLAQEQIEKLGSLSQLEDKLNQAILGEKINLPRLKENVLSPTYIDFRPLNRDKNFFCEIAEAFNSELMKNEYESLSMIGEQLRSKICKNVDQFLLKQPFRDNSQSFDNSNQKREGNNLKKEKFNESCIEAKVGFNDCSLRFDSENKQKVSRAIERDFDEDARNQNFSFSNMNQSKLISGHSPEDANLNILEQLKKIENLVRQNQNSGAPADLQTHLVQEKSDQAFSLRLLQESTKATKEEVELIQAEIASLKEEYAKEKEENDSISAVLSAVMGKRKIVEADLNWTKSRREWAEALLAEAEKPTEHIEISTPRNVFSLEASGLARSEDKSFKKEDGNILSPANESKMNLFQSFQGAGLFEKKDNEKEKDLSSAELQIVALIKRLSNESRTSSEAQLKAVQETLEANGKLVEISELRLSELQEHISMLAHQKLEIENEIKIKKEQLSSHGQTQWEIKCLQQEIRAINAKLKLNSENDQNALNSLGEDVGRLSENTIYLNTACRKTEKVMRHTVKTIDLRCSEDLSGSPLKESFEDISARQSEAKEQRKSLALLHNIYESEKDHKTSREGSRKGQDDSVEGEMLSESQRSLTFAYSLIYKLYLSFFTFCSKQFLMAVKTLRPSGYKELKQKMKAHYFSLLRQNRFFETISNGGGEPRYSLDTFVRALRRECGEWEQMLEYLTNFEFIPNATY